MQTEVQFADGSNGAMLAVETSRGWFVDWLSFTGAGDLTVAEFLEKKPPQSTLLLVMLAAKLRAEFPFLNRAYKAVFA